MREPSIDGPGRAGERSFRYPTLQVAAAEFRAQYGRALGGPIGCLCMLAGVASVVTFLWFADGSSRALLAGSSALLLGAFVARRGLIIFSWIGAVGAGAAIAGAVSLAGIESAWVYWLTGAMFAIAGCSSAYFGTKSWSGFFRARSGARRFGCRIGLFRPFHPAYSEQAKNLLLPLLRGYGSAYFVTDRTFDESPHEGVWSKDYKGLPGLDPGCRYPNEEWQAHVKAEIEKLDVAVIDISVPSPSVVWEIKQCYERLPSHRIVFVASAAVLPGGLPPDTDDPEFQAALHAHLAQILGGLRELGANPTTKPLCLFYSPTVEGQVWLANALFQAMANVHVVEGNVQPHPRPN